MPPPPPPPPPCPPPGAWSPYNIPIDTQSSSSSSKRNVSAESYAAQRYRPPGITPQKARPLKANESTIGAAPFAKRPRVRGSRAAVAQQKQAESEAQAQAPHGPANG